MTVMPPIQTEDLPQKGFDPLVTRQIVGFLVPYQLPILGALLLMAITAAAAAAGPYFIKVALDSGIAEGNPWVLRDMVLYYLFAAVLQWVTVYFRVLIMARVGQSIIFDLRDQMFARPPKTYH